MTMETGNITYGSVRSAVVNADNSAAGAEREYGISAELNFKEGALTAIGNGRVTDLESGQTLASFGEDPDGSLWLSLHRHGDDGQAVLAAIKGFTADCQRKAAAEPPSVV